MFKGVGMRSAALRATGAVLTAVLLSSCGGGEQVEKFVPSRIISFGDENSLIEPGGAKYTVNAVTTATPPAPDCVANPIWNQYLGQAFGLVFPSCNPTGAVTTSEIRATNNAKVADVAAQIDAFKATSPFTNKTLVTILVGQNDVLEQYDAWKAGTVSEDQARATIEQRGTTLAGLVNSVGLAGGKVLISTIPNLGTTPRGIAEEASKPGATAFLSDLSSRFNLRLRVSLINDGKMTGLLLSDESVSGAISKVGTTFINVNTAVCGATPVLTCTTATTIPLPAGTTTAPSGENYLWADDIHLSSGGHKMLGALAVTRATGNPF